MKFRQSRIARVGTEWPAFQSARGIARQLSNSHFRSNGWGGQPLTRISHSPLKDNLATGITFFAVNLIVSTYTSLDSQCQITSCLSCCVDGESFLDSRCKDYI